MAIENTLAFTDGANSPFQAVAHFQFDANGGCVADIGLYADRLSAELCSPPTETKQVRCDGVTIGEDTKAQIYARLATMPDFANATPISPDAIAGYANPVAPRPEAPSLLHEWDGVAWVFPVSALEGVRQLARERITQGRNNEEAGGFLAYGKTFDSDAASLQRLSVAIKAAEIVGSTFEIEWTCADNSTITLDYAQTLALPVIMAQAGNALHVKARNLKAQIDAATTLEEIQAVQW